jgi:hypothetical protein
LAAIVESARLWQKESWLKRALHKWRPEEKTRRAGVVERLSKGIRGDRKNKALQADPVPAQQPCASPQLLHESFQGNPFQKYAKDLQFFSWWNGKPISVTLHGLFAFFQKWTAPAPPANGGSALMKQLFLIGKSCLPSR